MNINQRKVGEYSGRGKEKQRKQKEKDKLPFAVFVCPKSNVGEVEDYKHVFTDIISDRIKQKYK